MGQTINSIQVFSNIKDGGNFSTSSLTSGGEILKLTPNLVDVVVKGGGYSASLGTLVPAVHIKKKISAQFIVQVHIFVH